MVGRPLAPAVSLVLAGLVAATVEVARPAPAPQIGTGRGNVVALAVSGSTVVYSLDAGDRSEPCAALRVWLVAAARTRTPDRPVCDSEFAAYYDVAVAGSEIVWSETYESNHTLTEVYAASAVRSTKPRLIDRKGWEGEDAFLGALAADGETVAFSTQAGSYEGGADAKLWIGDTRTVRAARHITGWMTRVAVDGDRVAVGYRNGRVELFHSEGALVGSLPAGTAARGMELEGGRLATMTSTRVVIRDGRSGATLESRPLGRPGSSVWLADVRNGLVVYGAGRDRAGRAGLRLLRLRDGRDVRLPVAPARPPFLHARFGSNGLVVAYPHVVKLMPWTTLPALFARG